MEITKFGWFTKGDYIFSYRGSIKIYDRQTLVFKVVERIHEKEARRIVYLIEVIDAITRKKKYKAPVKLEFPVWEDQIRVYRGKSRTLKRLYWKMNEEEIHKHVLMETI
jgi:hypothetical protein